MLPILKGGKATNCDLKTTTIGDNGANIMVWFYFNFLTLGQLLSSADNLCNSLDPDQARQKVRPDLDPNCLTL